MERLRGASTDRLERSDDFAPCGDDNKPGTLLGNRDNRCFSRLIHLYRRL